MYLLTELSNVDIENVDLNCASKKVNKREAESPHWNVEKWDLVPKFVNNR